MKRLTLLALLVLGCTGQPRYVRFPAETVDTLRTYLNVSGPASLKFYDSAGTKWMLVEPDTTGGKALLPGPVFQPLDKSHICPPDCP